MNLLNIIKNNIIDYLYYFFLKNEKLRFIISNSFIYGEGLEVGALHNPLKVNKYNTNVKYVDRMNVQDLRKHYPELNNLNLVTIDIIDNGEKLFTISNASQDFIIANHMLEHCVNPIKTIETFLSKLKQGGKIYLSIPDKRFTFDRNRSLTSFEHLVYDYHESDTQPQIHHFEEWVEYCENIDRSSESFSKIVKDRVDLNYSIHYHVWESESYLDFLIKTKEFLKNIFSIEVYIQNNDEIISILVKK